MLPTRFASLLAISWALGCVSVNAQWMKPSGPHIPKTAKVIQAKDVPKALADGAALRFDMLDMVFDGGSRVALFKRENGRELHLVFVNPIYWTDQAKKNSKQPVAIVNKPGLVEVTPDSSLQKRLVELINDDLANGNYDEKKKAVLKRVRDRLRDRQPLQELTEDFDPETWERKPDPILNDDPFGS